MLKTGLSKPVAILPGQLVAPPLRRVTQEQAREEGHYLPRVGRGGSGIAQLVVDLQDEAVDLGEDEHVDADIEVNDAGLLFVLARRVE